MAREMYNSNKTVLYQKIFGKLQRNLNFALYTNHNTIVDKDNQNSLHISEKKEVS